jgi:uncharacterized protein (TIGR02246 family)
VSRACLEAFVSRSALLALALVLVTAPAARAQRADDLTTIDGLMRAYDDVVSGPAGTAPDQRRDESLHLPGAPVGVSRGTANGGTAVDMMTLAGFYEKFGGVRKAPFYEWEIHRVTRQFGNVAHLWSTHAVGAAPGEPITRRGVTSLQLYLDGTRWWITGWITDEETAARPIPAEFLPGPAAAAAQAPGAEDAAAIREVVRRYADAREARDPKAIEALFTPDADQLVSSGEWRRGRDVLVKGALASSARTGGTRTLEVEAIRMAGPDVAIADARYEISGLDGGATRKMWSTFVMARQQGAWRISAIRNMLPAAPAR